MQIWSSLGFPIWSSAVGAAAASGSSPAAATHNPMVGSKDRAAEVALSPFLSSHGWSYQPHHRRGAPLLNFR